MKKVPCSSILAGRKPFKVYDIDHGAIVSSALLSTMGQGHAR